MVMGWWWRLTSRTKMLEPSRLINFITSRRIWGNLFIVLAATIEFLFNYTSATLFIVLIPRMCWEVVHLESSSEPTHCSFSTSRPSRLPKNMKMQVCSSLLSCPWQSRSWRKTLLYTRGRAIRWRRAESRISSLLSKKSSTRKASNKPAEC